MADPFAAAGRLLSPAELWSSFCADPHGPALRALEDRYGGRVLDVCRAILRDELSACEAYQDVFIALYERRDRIADPDTLERWLCGAAVKKALERSRTRARKWKREQPLPIEMPATPGPESGANEEHIAQVLTAFAKLRPYDQSLLRLKFWDGLSHAQIAEQLGKSVDAVDCAVYRALNQIRKRLGAVAVTGCIVEAVLARPARAVGIRIASEAILRSSAGRGAALGTGGWGIGSWKKVAVLTLATAAGIGGIGWLVAPTKPGPSTETLDPNIRHPVADPETYQARTVRVFRTAVEPNLLVALKPMALGDGSVELAGVRAYDTRIVASVLLHHRPPGAPPFDSEISFDHDTWDKSTRPGFAFVRGGQGQEIDPARPIILWHNPWGGRDLVLQSRPLQDALDAFKSLTPDGRLPAEYEKRRQAVERAMKRYEGVWYQYGDPARVCRIAPMPKTWNYTADAFGHDRAHLYFCNVVVIDGGEIGRIDLFGHRVQLSPDGRRLSIGGSGEWWAR